MTRMAGPRSAAGLAAKVGWEAKGWPQGSPWIGLPFHLQQVVLDLARRDGAPIDSRADGRLVAGAAVTSLLFPWQDVAVRALGEVHPMHPNPRLTVQRAALAQLERLLPTPERVMPVPGRDLGWTLAGQGTELSASHLLASEPPRALRGQLRRLGLETRPTGPAWERWLTVAPVQARLWSLAWLARLEQGIARGDTELQVRVLGDDPLPWLGLWDALELLVATAALRGQTWTLPRVTVEAPGQATDGLTACYLGTHLKGGARTPLAPVIFGEVAVPDVVVGPPGDVGPGDEATYWPPEAVLAALQAVQQEMERPEGVGRAVTWSPEILNFMFARFLGHPALRDEQAEALSRALGDEHLLVILPTGYGKSAIYQMVGLLQPGVTLVVSPLTALIEDQLAHLRALGVVGAGGITGSGEAATSTLELFDTGSFRLFYCAPERFATARFEKHLENLLARNQVAQIAVDEAHCVSEWGHDFRTSYMHVRRLSRELSARAGQLVPILALTATASTLVRSDISRALGIPPEHTVDYHSSDRPELSFSVHPVEGRRGEDARQRALEEVFVGVMPTLFGPGALSEQEGGCYQAGAVVFVPYAETHEPALFHATTSVVAEKLRRLFPEVPVGTSGGSPPGRCPECESHAYYRDWGKRHVCTQCGHRFQKAEIRRATQAEWDTELAQTQRDFLDSRLPVLVSTKGFGMGVDKANVRLVAHQVMSGSLEGYYQEAGRAGRDGEHAHVAMVTVLPHRNCRQEWLESGALTATGPGEPIPLPCLKKDAGGYRTRNCPYGLAELCDIGQQAAFIDDNFPSAAQERDRMQTVQDQLPARGRAVVRYDRAVWQDDRVTERALARLMSLGVVERYSAGQGTFTVHVQEGWEAESALRTLEQELRGFDELTGSPGSSLGTLHQVWDRALASRQSYVRYAGTALLETLYTTVRYMRLRSLMNLYGFASLAPGECRRAYLRRRFETVPLEQGYACGFCDTCVPDLTFQANRAAPSRSDAARALMRTQARQEGRVPHLDEAQLTALIEVGESFEAMLDGSFELSRVLTFLGRCFQAGAASSILGRSTYLLEQRPNDLNLLFVAAALQASEGLAEPAWQLAVRATGVMRRAGAGAETLHGYLSGLANWLPGLVVDLCTEVGGPFDDPAGRPLGVEVLRRTDPVQAQQLQDIWSTSGMVNQVRTMLAAVSPVLEPRGQRQGARRKGRRQERMRT